MSRFSPFSEQRPQPLVEPFPITNQRTGAIDTVALQFLDDILSDKANDLALNLTFRYVGIPQQEMAPTEDFPPIDGKVVEVSGTLCQKVANLYTMQAQRPEGGDLYSCEELIAFAATNDITGIWEQLQSAAEELNKRGNKRKNALRASGISGSKTPSAGDSRTPNSLPEPTPCSVPSTSDSELSANTSFETEAAAT